MDTAGKARLAEHLAQDAPGVLARDGGDKREIVIPGDSTGKLGTCPAGNAGHAHFEHHAAILATSARDSRPDCRGPIQSVGQMTQSIAGCACGAGANG
jgi:hypothetical protein